MWKHVSLKFPKKLHFWKYIFSVPLLQTKVICLSWQLQRVKAAAIWASLPWPAGSLEPANQGEVNYPHWLGSEVLTVQDSSGILRVMILLGTVGLILFSIFLSPNGAWKLSIRQHPAPNTGSGPPVHKQKHHLLFPYLPFVSLRCFWITVTVRLLHVGFTYKHQECGITARN